MIRTRAAPSSSAVFAIRTPIGPAPITKTRSPSVTDRDTTWTAFAIGSVSVATWSVTSASKRTAASEGTTNRSAKPPVRSRPTSLPVAQWLIAPCRHHSQEPHDTIGFNTTRSPRREPGTPSPISEISPTVSWPMISGGIRRGLASRNPCRSDPQIADARDAIVTSPGPGVGSGASWSSMRPGPM